MSVAHARRAWWPDLSSVAPAANPRRGWSPAVPAVPLVARTAFSALVALTFLATATSPAVARAEATGDAALRYDLRIDLPLTAVAAILWVGSEGMKTTLAPEACRWCASNGLDAGVRDALLWAQPRRAHVLSNVLAFVAVPAAGFGLPALAGAREGGMRQVGVDALIIAEAVALSIDLNQLVKFSVGRERPFVHALPAADKPHAANPADNDLSFYSGHTNFAFAFAAAAGSVASMRRYRMAPVVWGIGLTLAAATGYLRIAADKHYFTDVMTGALLGTVTGAATPWLLHRPLVPGGGTLALAPLPGGAAAGLRWGL